MNMELKPCPFCGGKAAVHQIGVNIMPTNHDSVRFDFSIRCTNCKVSAPFSYGYIAANLSSTGDLNVWHDDRTNAIVEWNRRANKGGF